VAGRPLGIMVTYGYPDIELDDELDLAVRFGAEVLEILPEWRLYPVPGLVRARAVGRGLAIHSAHGCWGGQSIRARRVDLGAVDRSTHEESIDDLKRCVDWLLQAGGACLVVHPGGLSDPLEHDVRRGAVARGLMKLAEHARGTQISICVENMPPGVHPGSRMPDLARLLAELGQPELALALDTGHANMGDGVSAETLAAGGLLATTHVHDNNGRQDSHEPPGHGTVDWPAWGRALDVIGYRGPILLECIRRLRNDPASFHPQVLTELLRSAHGGAIGPDRF
jgi:sugar phosphate isomerase/epimerase